MPTMFRTRRGNAQKFKLVHRAATPQWLPQMWPHRLLDNGLPLGKRSHDTSFQQCWILLLYQCHTAEPLRNSPCPIPLPPASTTPSTEQSKIFNTPLFGLWWARSQGLCKPHMHLRTLSHLSLHECGYTSKFRSLQRNPTQRGLSPLRCAWLQCKPACTY